MSCVNNSLAELATLYPVEGGFISLATHFVDPAIGFMVGWNFFLYEALLIPFEISAINVVLGYWRSDIPVWAVCVGCIVAYGYVCRLFVLTSCLNGYGLAVDASSHHTTQESLRFSSVHSPEY